MGSSASELGRRWNGPRSFFGHGPPLLSPDAAFDQRLRLFRGAYLRACGVSCDPILLLSLSELSSQDPHDRYSGSVSAFGFVRPQIGNQGGEAVESQNERCSGGIGTLAAAIRKPRQRLANRCPLGNHQGILGHVRVGRQQLTEWGSGEAWKARPEGIVVNESPGQKSRSNAGWLTRSTGAGFRGWSATRRGRFIGVGAATSH